MEMKKIHLSTVAVISHSPVSWHERTNNVCYRWHLSCITLCISSSFGKSCFHICWLIFFFFFFGFHVERLLISTLRFTVQLTWSYMLQKENIQMPSEIWEKPILQSETILKPQAVGCWLQPFIEMCLLSQCMAITMIFKSTALTNTLLLNEI